MLMDHLLEKKKTSQNEDGELHARVGAGVDLV
jgi:hypothetical protein